MATFQLRKKEIEKMSKIDGEIVEKHLKQLLPFAQLIRVYCAATYNKRRGDKQRSASDSAIFRIRLLGPLFQTLYHYRGGLLILLSNVTKLAKVFRAHSSIFLAILILMGQKKIRLLPISITGPESDAVTGAIFWWFVSLKKATVFNFSNITFH